MVRTRWPSRVRWMLRRSARTVSVRPARPWLTVTFCLPGTRVSSPLGGTRTSNLHGGALWWSRWWPGHLERWMGRRLWWRVAAGPAREVGTRSRVSPCSAPGEDAGGCRPAPIRRWLPGLRRATRMGRRDRAARGAGSCGTARSCRLWWVSGAWSAAVRCRSRGRSARRAP